MQAGAGPEGSVRGTASVPGQPGLVPRAGRKASKASEQRGDMADSHFNRFLYERERERDRGKGERRGEKRGVT